MKVFLTSVLAIAALSSGSIVKPSGDNFELLILHNNDMHARFEQTSQLSGACTAEDREAGKCYGGFPRVAHVVKEARKAAQTGEGPPVLYLNAGDTYTGTAWFTIYKWKIAAEFINALQPDAVSLGNHEVEDSISELASFINNLTCPVLAANLDLSKVPELQVQMNLVNSIILDVNGTKIGIIGYITPDTKILSINNDIEYIEEVTAIEQEIAKLKDEGVKIFIALGHSGYLKDLQIAKEIKDIDLVIGGHSHTFLWNGTNPDIEISQGPYPTFVQQESGRMVPTVQAYAHTKYLGKLHLVFDSDGELIHTDGKPILLDNTIPQDPTVLQIVKDYHKKMQQYTEQIIGSTSVNLDGDSCRLSECNMGNFINDAIVEKYASEYEGDGWSDAPIAVMNSGDIRTSITSSNLPRNITKGDYIQVLPFSGSISKISLKGNEVILMLEHSAAKYNPLDARGQFLQVSGIKVEYNIKKPPGERVEKVYMRCGNCSKPEYFDLNETETYQILLPSYLVKGGDGYDFLTELPASPVDFVVFDAITKYLTKYGSISPTLEGRIFIKDKQ